MPYGKAPPVIVMEEYIFAKRMDQWLTDKQTYSSAPVYRVLTEVDNPQPLLPNQDPYHNTEKAYGALIKTLRHIGVKKIVIGGMQFETDSRKTDWTYKPPWVGRCVGKALSWLSKDKAGEFETDISFLIDSPYERKWYIEAISRGKRSAYVP